MKKSQLVNLEDTFTKVKEINNIQYKIVIQPKH